jgi:hypothetical protein
MTLSLVNNLTVIGYKQKWLLDVAIFMGV